MQNPLPERKTASHKNVVKTKYCQLFSGRDSLVASGVPPVLCDLEKAHSFIAQKSRQILLQYECLGRGAVLPRCAARLLPKNLGKIRLVTKTAQLSNGGQGQLWVLEHILCL